MKLLKITGRGFVYLVGLCSLIAIIATLAKLIVWAGTFFWGRAAIIAVGIFLASFLGGVIGGYLGEDGDPRDTGWR